MSQDATPSGIYEWITANLRPRSTDTATLRFERMESQSDQRLPEVYCRLDPAKPGHWAHRGWIWDFVLSLEGAEQVLDVGPGDGWPALLMAPHCKGVIGIEPGPQRVAVCKANARRMRLRKARFEQMSACEMSFDGGSFDGVVAATAIEQTSDPLAALREIHRVLTPGGILRMSYETVEAMPEPVREAVAIQHGPEGGYRIEYSVTWARSRYQHEYSIEVGDPRAASRERLGLWARRCQKDAYPHRDPRLERGLAQTIKALRAEEVASARVARIRHFGRLQLAQMLQRIGFRGIRTVVGGGWPARQCAEELLRSRRIEAAAPLMEELCRGAAQIGIALDSQRGGQVIARKPRKRVRRRVSG